MIYFWIIVVLMFSAFFSASEIAFVSADRLRIELEKSHGRFYSRMLAIFFDRPDLFITTMLVGNNIALVIYGLLMALLLEPYFHDFISNDFMVVFAQTLVSTILILIVAEFIPKAVSKLNPNWQLRNFALPLFLLYILLYPIALFSSWLSKILFKLFRIKDLDEKDVRLGRLDLDNYIESNAQGDQPSLNNEVKILQNALDFPDVKVRDCLVPRNEITAVNIDTTKDELIEIFDSTGYSKILVYKDTIDDLVGYIHAIEMFKNADHWQQHINPTIYVPETQAADKVMRLLMQKKKSIAIVVDELGGTAGIVTLEDIVEEIFGEIEDEHDIKSVVMRKLSEDEYILSGRAEVDQVNEVFEELELPLSDEYKTISGLLIDFYQGFPKRGEEIHYPPHFLFRIIRSTGNKIGLVKLKVIKP
ncbi:hemolysin family protein [Porphyromonas sp.]|uniref:hemolysin family protein n=1 Tax=Porphyromonas sp. TaxID=1924944 RepID=UPI0026DC1EC2|nr:hemolysin family protein [Porphyromonas sp.]MDO4770614.1 hemolysin family protein [Porphyromonas sp.]